MRKRPLSLLVGLFILISNIAVSQCQYSFSSFGQSVYLNGDPSMTNVNTLSTCAEYVFDYSIQFSSTSVTSVTDDITIELPLNVSFQSLASSNGTVTVNSSTANTVSLNISGWTIGSTPLKIEVTGISSSCDASTVTGNPLAELTGDLACNVAHSVNGVTIVSPQLIVDNISQPTSVSLTKNIGDVDEIVFKIRNSGANGTVIQDLLIDYTLNSIINSFQNNYYLSSSSTQGTGTNSYTYTLPGSIYAYTLPASTIPIGPADFQNVLGHGYLGNNEEIYLHIPYFVNSCGASTGNFNFKRDCGNSVTCDNVALVHNISVISGMPNISTGNLALIHDENATFCATASGQDMDLGWHMVGSNSVASGGPLGYSRVTDLQLLLLVDNSFGSVDPSSFTISNGSSSINVGAYTTVESTTFPVISTSTTGTLYKIHLDQLPVSGTNWQPLGANSLSDLDGDGYVDDLIEYGTLDIHVDYTYNTTCPLYSDHQAYYTIAALEWHYSDACGTPVISSAQGGNFQWGGDKSTYQYNAVGPGGELTLPPDVLANQPFVSELCFAPYYETYSGGGFEFDCPNGFHRVIYEVPNGYHLNLTGLTVSTTQPGWYELPPITATSISGVSYGTVQITPIVKEYCSSGGSGRTIEVRFGLLPSDLSNGLTYTYQLECLGIPMYLNCSSSDPACPGLPNNFGFDHLNFRLEFVCDETCNTCSSYLIGAGASTFHHCPGLCASYFGTEPNPLFKRTSLGFNNTPTGYILGSDLTQPSNLTTNTEPTIDLSRAYPGDQISLNVNGSFKGTPGGSYTANTGASYNDINLQIRYNDLPAGERKEARLFDLEQLTGDKIRISENGNPSSFVDIPVSDMVMTDFVSSGIVHQNINFLTPAAVLFMNDATKEYLFSSYLHLRVRAEPISPTNHYFFSVGKHIIESLRFEYKGTETDSVTIDGSCDDYGANFTILQPSATQPNYTYIGEGTYCGETEVSLRFYNDAALFNIENDFSNEYRAYAQWGKDVDITIPAGYSFISAYFHQDWKQYNTSGPNNFGPIYASPTINLPIIPQSVTPVGGNTVVHFSGLDGTDPNSSWPSLDLEVSTGSQYIYLKLLPDCDAPQHSLLEASGTYTLGVNQNLAAYQYEFPFSNTVDLGHYAPNINVINPIATVNAYDGTAEFTFSVCNENVFMTGPANQAWFAFENSAVNGLDLTNATLVSLPGNIPVPFTTYTDGLGNQGIIVNYGLITQQNCVNFKLTAHVSSNGCVTGNTSVADYITVYGGNSCDGSIFSSPVEECTNDIAQFAFNRYPSDLELILPVNAYPTNPVEMCNGILEYNFILNSYEVGGVNDVDFWLDLPTGLSLQNISFSNIGSSPASYTTSSYDGTTYGSGGNLPGWTVLPHLNMTYLPGSLSTNNQILVHLEVQSSCGYDLTSPVLCYANSTNSCGILTDLLEMSSLPLISNTTLANDLVITPVITFSDESDTLNCFNEATVTLTIANNSNVSNLTDFTITAQVPGSPLVVDPGTGTLTGNEITWPVSVGSIPANSSITVSYSLTNPGVICQNDVPMSAVIDFSQDVSCTSTGGSCSVDMTTDTVYFDIDVCCNCEVEKPLFHIANAYCYGSTIAALPTTSLNGITGTWSPSTISNTTSGTVVFTPDTGQCATTYTLDVTINPVPTITVNSATICPGESATLTASGGSVYYWTPSSTLSSPSGATVTATPTTTTSYVVTGTNEFGCSSTATAIVTVNPLITPTFKMMDTYCVGSTPNPLPNPSLNGISGTWSPSTINTSTAGDFVYTFTPNPGQCAATVTVTIHIVAPTTPTFSLANTFCAGASVPALTSPSGNGIYGSWSPTTISNTTSGSYVFTPTAGQCATTYTLNVTINPNPVPAITYQDGGLSICDGTTIPLFSSSATGNTWSTGETTQTIYVSTAGSYTVTVDNGNGCSATSAPAVVTVNPNPTISGTFTACQGGSTVTLTGSPGPGTWSSSNPSVATVNSSGVVTPSSSSSGTTTIIYTVTATGCQKQQTFTVYPNPVPTISHGDGSLTICSGSSITLTSSSATNNTWSTGATTQSITVTTAGTYTVTVNNGNGCSATSAPVTVTVNSVPVLNTISNISVCSGATVSAVTFSTSPVISGTTYSWTNTNTGVGLAASGSGNIASYTAPTVSSVTSGTITVTPYANGCYGAPKTFTITINPIPVLNSISNIVACGGTTVSAINFSTTPTISGTAYNWTNTNTGVGLAAYGSGNITSYTAPTVSSSTVGTITVTPNVNGCQGSSKTFTITINPKPVLSSQSNITVCPGTIVPATSFTSTPSGATLSWTNGNTSIGLGSGGAGNVPSFTATNSSGSAIFGNVSVNPLLNGCLGNTVSYSITVNPKPTITGTQTICVGATTSLTGGGTPASTSPWVSNNTAVATVSSTGVVTGVAAGSATITYTNSLGCQNTAAITVNPKPAVPTISADGPITFCYGSSVTLTSSSATNNLWSNGATTQDITVGNAGTYFVTVSNAYGCTNTSMGVTVNVTTATMAQPSNITVCPGTSVTVPAFSGATSYNWVRTAASIGLTATSGAGNIPTFTATNTGTSAISSIFTVTPVTTGGCGGPTKQFTITVNPRPAAPTISGPTTICDGETATLTSSYSTNIVWSPGGATTPSIIVPAPASSATYTVTYTGANGCTNSASTTVTKVTCSKPLKCVVSANLSVGVVSACERSFTNTSTVGSVPLTSSNTGYAYQWTVSNSNTNALLTSGTGFNLPNFTFSATGTYRVCLRVTRIALPDCYDEYCVEISVNCSSSLVLSSHTNGLTSKFGVKDSEKETLRNVDYSWDFGDGTSSTEEKPVHTYARAGSYKVCVKIGNGDLTETPVSLCRTIDVSEDLTETGTIPVLSVNPNPTSGQTTVLLDGAEGKTVEIKLFNMLGEEVTTLFTKTCCNDEMIRVLWNAEEVPPGVYLVKAQVDSKTMVEKIVVSSH